jgi:hypothetical protein
MNHTRLSAMDAYRRQLDASGKIVPSSQSIERVLTRTRGATNAELYRLAQAEEMLRLTERYYGSTPVTLQQIETFLAKAEAATNRGKRCHLME